MNGCRINLSPQQAGGALTDRFLTDSSFFSSLPIRFPSSSNGYRVPIVIQGWIGFDPYKNLLKTVMHATLKVAWAA